MAKSSKGGQLTQHDARQLLKRKRLRCSPARLAILQCLASAPEPNSAGAIAAQVASYGFDKSTIYRALTDLNEAGLVTCLEIGDRPRHFELSPAAGGARVVHPHFVCTDCDRIYCLEPSQVALTHEPGGAALPGEPTEVLIKGRCDDCQ